MRVVTVFSMVFMLRLIVSLSWLESSVLLPEPMIRMCTGYKPDTDSIWLIGAGYWVIQYNIIENNYTIHSNLPETVVPYSQSWTQKQDIIYMLTDWDEWITSFNMNLQTFNSQAISWSGTGFPCLSSDNYLFALGGEKGGTIVNDFKVYNFDTNQWINGPSMLIPRSLCACNSVDDKLYVIGGFNRISYDLDSVHMININDIQNINNYNWSELTDKLSSKKHMLRSVVYGSSIYVSGGVSFSFGQITDEVDIIDTATNTILLDSNLYQRVDSHGAVAAIQHSKIFVFGGYIRGLNTQTNQIQYASITDIRSTTFVTTTPPTDESTTQSSLTTLITSELTKSTTQIGPTAVTTHTLHHLSTTNTTVIHTLTSLSSVSEIGNINAGFNVPYVALKMVVLLIINLIL